MAKTILRDKYITALIFFFLQLKNELSTQLEHFEKRTKKKQKKNIKIKAEINELEKKKIPKLINLIAWGFF